MIRDKCLEQFSLVSKFSLKFAFASALSDWLKNERKKLALLSHPIQSIVTRRHTFDFLRVSRRPHVFTSSFDLFTGIYGFGFKTLIGKVLRRIAGKKKARVVYILRQPQKVIGIHTAICHISLTSQRARISQLSRS